MSSADLSLTAVARAAWNETKAEKAARQAAREQTRAGVQFEQGCQMLMGLLPRILGVKVNTSKLPPTELAHDFIPVQPDDADYDTRRPEAMRPGLIADLSAARPYRVNGDLMTATMMLDEMDYRPEVIRNGVTLRPDQVTHLEVRVIGHRQDRWAAFATLSDLGAALESHEQENPLIFDDRNED